MKKIRRFTLVELLAVVALIAILSAIGFGSYSYAMGKAKESSTQALMKQLEAGLERFYTQNGYYPQSGGTANVIKFDLSNGIVNGVSFNGNGEIFELAGSTGTTRADRLKNEKLASFTKALDIEVLKKYLNADGEVEDAWGGKIRYRAPGVFNTASFDLISPGSDGKFGAGKTDNPPNTLDKYRDSSTNEALCDDLFNF